MQSACLVAYQPWASAQRALNVTSTDWSDLWIQVEEDKSADILVQYAITDICKLADEVFSVSIGDVVDACDFQPQRCKPVQP